jgi:hypothetical protein
MGSIVLTNHAATQKNNFYFEEICSNVIQGGPY